MRREKISPIYQDFNLFPWLTVEENVSYPLMIRKIINVKGISMKLYHEQKAASTNLERYIAAHSANRTVAYKKVDEAPIYLGYYFPKDYNAAQVYPTFVMIHGGGWSTHKLFADQEYWQGDYLGYLARYYAEKGFVCVSVDYRLTKEKGQAEGFGILECYEDCCDAMDYILQHAEECGIDRQCIYLLGESAGGHLAGALATFHYDRTYAFKKVFLVNPITQLYDLWKEYVPEKTTHPQLAGMSLEERAEFLSPLCQLDKAVSEVILLHGEADNTVNPAHSLCFYERMQELGRPCTLHLLAGTKHAFLLAEYYKGGQWACETAIEVIDAACAL